MSMAKRDSIPGCTRLALALAGAVSLWAWGGCERHGPGVGPAHITVFAAASTVDVMRDAGARFEKVRGAKVSFSFDASSNLAKQIKAGAPADVFLSADQKWMDDVEASSQGGQGLLVPGSRQDLLASELVMIAPAGRKLSVRFEPTFDFGGQLPGIAKIAVGDPSHVPAGRYAKQALEALGWWDPMKNRIVPALDTRAALRLVEMSEADAGIVYSTDARSSTKVDVVGILPASLHDPIRYPIALCRGGKDANVAREFVAFLRSAEITRVFESAGFVVVSTEQAGKP